MRTQLACFVLLAACGAEVSEPDPTSVRERLATSTTVLQVSPTESAGAITASRKTSEGWSPGLADLRIDAGTISLSGDGDVVTLEDFQLDVGPIEVPETVLGYPLALTDIRLSLIAPVKMLAEWSGDNDAHGNGSIDLLLEWSLLNHDVKSPLGSPDLPPVPVEVVVSGDGPHVHAEVRVSAPGELWIWANVFRLEDLSLVIASDTH